MEVGRKDKREPFPYRTLDLPDGEYTITDIIGFGGSCIVYAAQKTSGSTGGGKSVILKEFYPKEIDGITLSRNADGSLIIPDCVRENFNALQKRYQDGVGAHKNAYNFDPAHIAPRPDNIERAAYGTYYFVTEPSRGEVLSRTNLATLELKDKAEIMISLCNAIDAIHNNENCLYLDIKPENIFLHEKYPNEPYAVSLFDFDTEVNLADLHNGHCQYGSVSQGWAPPEQVEWNASNISKSTDVFSLGAVFYWLLFETKPNLDKPYFHTTTRVQNYENDMEGEVLSRIGNDPAIAKAIRDILCHTLQYAKESRWSGIRADDDKFAKSLRVIKGEDGAGKPLPEIAWVLGGNGYNENRPFRIRQDGKRNLKTLLAILPGAYTLILASKVRSGFKSALDSVYDSEGCFRAWDEYNASALSGYQPKDGISGIVVNLPALQWEKANGIAKIRSQHFPQYALVINVFSDSTVQAAAMSLKCRKLIHDSIPFAECYLLTEPNELVNDYFFWGDEPIKSYSSIDGISGIIKHRKIALNTALTRDIDKLPDLSEQAKLICKQLNERSLDESLEYEFLLNVLYWVPELWETLMREYFISRTTSSTLHGLRASFDGMNEGVRIIRDSTQYVKTLLNDPYLKASFVPEDIEHLLSDINPQFIRKPLTSSDISSKYSIEFWRKLFEVFSPGECKCILNDTGFKDILNYILLQDKNDATYIQVSSDVCICELYGGARGYVHPTLE